MACGNPNLLNSSHCLCHTTYHSLVSTPSVYNDAVRWNLTGFTLICFRKLYFIIVYKSKSKTFLPSFQFVCK